MARDLLALNEIVITGLAPPAETTADATDKHYFENGTGTKLFLLVRNSGVVSRTLTIIIPGDVDTGIPKTDRSIVLTAGSSKYVGPFDSSIYNQEDDPDSLGTRTAVYLDPDHADLKLTLFEVP